ncbi:MAG: AbiEi antitoxin N-terminal domain-containing protein [Verrucomicrobia bacterium]|nr:AbiEi antitoxin N-terminal domain-containing protein [Verrucomicrobiota bacterium]
MNPRKTKHLMKAFKTATMLPSKELEARGLQRGDIQAAVRSGVISRVASGLYRFSEAEVTENHSLVQASRIVPHGVVCLLSALRFHETTTQAPHEVWLAVPRDSWRPKAKGIRLVQFAKNALGEGIEAHKIEGAVVRVTSLARTVADCFKFRNKIGLDVAVEALRDVRSRRKCSVDELLRQARLCRVAKVMQPYLEALS